MPANAYSRRVSYRYEPELREPPHVRSLRRLFNITTIVATAAGLWLAYLWSGLHLMVIWPSGGTPQVHYFRKSTDRELPRPVGRLAEIVGRP